MNIIFITLDGARIDRIERSAAISDLCKEGTCFKNMVTYAPYTIAAMHAVFSGEYGFKTGVNSYWSTLNFKKNKFKTLTEYLFDNGYETYGDAINPLIIPKQGFVQLEYHDEDKDDLVKRHKKLLQDMKEIVNKGRKFFLYLHYSSIHTNIKHTVLTKYNNFSKEYFDEKEYNSNKYDEYFSQAESYLKEIIKQCNDLKLLDDTLVIIFSDHGISIGDKFGERAYGVFCYDYTVRDFALFIKKGLFPTKTIYQQVRSIDILPTVLEVLKIEQDNVSYEKISGKSLMPLVNEKTYQENPAIMESGNPLNEKKPPKEPNVVAIRKNNHKLIVNLHNNTIEFYNLEEDPYEEKNLHDPSFKNKMEKELLDTLIDEHKSLYTLKKDLMKND